MPEAQTRVWIVQDGDTLYVDRNGNGDLTEPGEVTLTPHLKLTVDGVPITLSGATARINVSNPAAGSP